MRDLIGRTLGHYRVVEKIGEGGMGVVYQAHDERLDRDVAVKVLPEEVARDPERLKRFEREAKALAALNHPNIATVHGFETAESGTGTGTGTISGPHALRPSGPLTFLVMELLEGESLREVLGGGGVTTGKAVEYASSIADGLAAAHEKGIIHRDLKPENVFLTKDGRIKILDFGLAKLRLPETDFTTETPTETLDTAAGGLLGTVPYMAPEQVQGNPADHRSDIFALGVMLHEMLAGSRPFGGATGHETAAAILKEDPEPIAGVSPTLASVISKCLEKRPEDRFSSAHDLALTLGAVDQSATGKSFVERRWPHLVAVAVAVVIAMVFVLPPTGLFQRSEEPTTEATILRIVVLPFENLGSPDDEYFADGITEELISRLAAVSGLQVISRTSAMYYKGKRVPLKQIGEELDVGYVLEGTIRWDRGGEGYGRVRITPQLIRVSDDSHLWSERYDRVLEDIFTLQTSIAEQVVSRLEVTLMKRERYAVEAKPTENMEAYNAYLKAIEYGFQPGFIASDLESAVALFGRAVELDPAFTLAYVRLADAHLQIHWRVFASNERLKMAENAVETASSLDPNLPQVRLARGIFHFYGHHDYDAALSEFEAAKQDLPSDPEVYFWIGLVNRRQGRWEAGLANIRKASHLDPRSGVYCLEVGTTLTFMRRYEEARYFVKKSVELVPDQEFAYRVLAHVFRAESGDLVQARSAMEAMPRRETPSSFQSRTIQCLFERDYPSALRVLSSAPDELLWREPKVLWVGLAHELNGDVDKARDAYERGKEILARRLESELADPWWSHCQLGLALAHLGDTESAIQQAQLAEESLPLSKDAVFGSLLAVRLAEVYTAAGDHEGALDRIEHLMSVPAGLVMSRSILDLDPVWDPLRDQPRFQALLEKYDTN